MKQPRIALVAVLPAVIALSACSFNASVGSSAPVSPAVTQAKPAEPSPLASSPSATAKSPEPTAPVEPPPSAQPATPTATSTKLIKADPVGIEKSAADGIEQQVGVRPVIDCGAAMLDVTVGGTHVCSLTVSGKPEIYDVTITFTEVHDDGTFRFRYDVAKEPRP